MPLYKHLFIYHSLPAAFLQNPSCLVWEGIGGYIVSCSAPTNREF